MVIFVNDSITFKNKEELYSRVLPALFSKVKETRRLGLKYIGDKDIWNYLVETEWSRRKNLELYDLISDILNVDNYRLQDYVLEKMQKLKQEEKTDIKDINDSNEPVL